MIPLSGTFADIGVVIGYNERPASKSAIIFYSCFVIPPIFVFTYINDGFREISRVFKKILFYFIDF